MYCALDTILNSKKNGQIHNYRYSYVQYTFTTSTVRVLSTSTCTTERVLYSSQTYSKVIQVYCTGDYRTRTVLLQYIWVRLLKYNTGTVRTGLKLQYSVLYLYWVQVLEYKSLYLYCTGSRLRSTRIQVYRTCIPVYEYRVPVLVVYSCGTGILCTMYCTCRYYTSTVG